MTDSFSKLREIVTKADDILLICHERADGDSIGSLLALGGALERMGKKVSMVSRDPVPSVFSFLLNSEKIQDDFLLGSYDAVILLDNGDLRRTGYSERLANLRKKNVPLVNIDHHPKNDLWRLSDVNYINEGACSTCEILHEVLIKLGCKIDSQISTALLTGIFTDTGGFRHANTNQNVLNIASALLNSGAKLQTISANISYSHSAVMLKLWGIALSRLMVNKKLSLAYSILTRQDIDKIGAADEEVSGLVNLISSLPDSKAALLIYETADGKIRGSLRTESDSIDLTRLAKLFGGGGHRRASGFSIPGQIEQIGGVWQVV